MFLRCLEANLLSDMALQGIEQISKVTSPPHPEQDMTSNHLFIVVLVPVATVIDKFYCKRRNIV